MAKWTQMTYILVAKVLRQYGGCRCVENGNITHIAVRFADEFERDNDRFDRQKFLSACGV